MSTRTGLFEHITKGISFCGDRKVHIYFALVQIADHNTYNSIIKFFASKKT